MYTMHVAIIGGGIFGIMVALRLAERGLLVTIFEKNKDILLGASYINQYRMHMGYHYPRSKETAKSSYNSYKAFCNIFKECIVDNFNHYYCIAKHGSLTSNKQYKEFCDWLGLPYVKEFPTAISISQDEVELCIKVPEKLYDPNILRDSLKSLLKNQDRIRVLLSTEVINIIKNDKGFEVHSKNGDRIIKEDYGVIVNTTYSNINKIAKMAGFKTREYQYELCEVVVVEVPWTRRTGCAIFDGQFFGILPLGFSEKYVLCDVELSVLERSYGELPEFKFDAEYYDQEDVRAERFKRYIEKSKKYIKEMENCKYLYSMYITKILLSDKEYDDARLTEILYYGNGFWSILSGKVSTAIPTSEKIAEEIDHYFNTLK